MSNPQNAVTPEASATSQTNNESTGDFQLAPGESVSAAFMRFVDSGKSETGSDKSLTPELIDSDNSSIPEAKDDGQSPETKEKKEQSPRKDDENVSPGVKKRIDSLTAKYKAEVEANREEKLRSAKLEAALRLLQKDHERILKRAQLDPHEEQLEELKIQREIDKLDREIPTRLQEEYSKKAIELEQQERAAQIYETIQAATAEYEGLFTIGELARYMKANEIFDPMEASRKLADQRLEAAQKRLKQPAAPKTVGHGASSREPAQPFTYKGPNQILEFLHQEEQKRRGY